ncbi:hypothetical protein [Paenibacillus terrae]|uniref:hypothetical protein n=1 Tax=Paenibacillus terrae TaxID=159743 RepID=UPI0011EB7115|nr:hypothetical protein [Paenibacillus terrae]
MNISLSTDSIREFALDLLKTHQAGIKQADFFKQVELLLSQQFHVPSYAVRNALWDLPERHDDLVIKRKLSYRDVRLFPTDRLLQHDLIFPLSASLLGDEINKIPSRGDEDTISKGDTLKKELDKLHFQTEQLLRTIQMNDLEAGISQLLNQYFSEIEPEQMAALLQARYTLSQVTASLTQLAKAIEVGENR